MKTEQELTEIYNSLNKSERFGIQFGLFPVKLINLTTDETVLLMEIRSKKEKNDVNN